MTACRSSSPRRTDRWLGDAEDPRDLLKPYPSEPMHKWEVGLRVNNVRNDDPGLLEPAPEDDDTLF